MKVVGFAFRLFGQLYALGPLKRKPVIASCTLPAIKIESFTKIVCLVANTAFDIKFILALNTKIVKIFNEAIGIGLSEFFDTVVVTKLLPAIRSETSFTRSAVSCFHVEALTVLRNELASCVSDKILSNAGDTIIFIIVCLAIGIVSGLNIIDLVNG